MAKQELNAFDVLAAARELSALVGARFDKAFQPTREEVVLRLRASRRMREEAAGGAEPVGSASPKGRDLSGGAASLDEQDAEDDSVDGADASSAAAAAGPVGAAGVLPTESSKVELAIGVGRYICVTEFPREMPIDPSQFAMTLRKHLSGARVNGVRQHGFDRVIEFELSRKEGTYHLVVEFFHDGNIILEREGRVVAALLQQSWATREIRPGAEFRMPPPRADPKTMGFEDFRERFRASQSDAVRTLATEFGLGGTWSEEVCARADVAKNLPQSEIPDAGVVRIYDELARALIRTDAGALEPVLVKRGDEKVDVSPLPLREHEKPGLELERFPTFMAALDRYFSKAVTVERVDPRVKKLDAEKQKVQRMYDAQKAAITKFEAESEASRERGDLLYGHFALVQKLSDRILHAAKEFGWKEVQGQLKGARKAGQQYAQYIEAIDPNEGKGTFVLPDGDGREMRVVIDIRKSVQDNANAYYERSKKFRDKLAGAKEAFSGTEARLKDIEERGVKILEDVDRERSRAKPTKRFWFESYRWFVSSDGHLVLAGRDASSNEKLVKKHLEDNDRYLHADVSGAPSCVVKGTGGDVPERTLEEAAQFAVGMSRAWIAGVAAGEAYWVTPTQVSKTPNPGEFVAKGAFIIRGKRNYMRAHVRLAVGEVEYEGARKVMGGPVDAVKARAKRYLVIEPGPHDRNKLANRLSETFGVPVEEVQAVLPPGDVTVVEEHL